MPSALKEEASLGFHFLDRNYSKIKSHTFHFNVEMKPTLVVIKLI